MTFKTREQHHRLPTYLDTLPFTNMPSTKSLTFAALLSLASASPLVARAPTLSRRQIVSYNDCSDPQKKKLQQDFGDAATFAQNAYDLMSGDNPA